MRLSKKQLDDIIEVIFDYADYGIEVNGPQDFDVVPNMPKNVEDNVWSVIQRILEENNADMQGLFDLQLKFQARVRKERDYKYMPWIEHVRLMFIGIITEACEVLEETNWKPWKKHRLINDEKLKEEIIDLWHFVINLTIASDMNAREVIKRFKEKNKVNIKRQEDKY